MKKFAILITSFLLVLQAAQAQTQKGDQNLGVSIGFYTNGGSYNYVNVSPGSFELTSTKSTGFSANPNYSYFIAKNLDIGASIGFGSETDNSNDHTVNAVSKLIYKSYSSSIYLRKYFLYNNKIGIRTGPYLGYQYTNSNAIYTPDNNQANYNTNSHYYHAGLNADFVYYPSHKIGLAVNLGDLSYYHSKYGNQQISSGTDGVSLELLNNNLMLSAFYVFD
ncbi:MAG: hypothetical protein JWP37_2119 [Mucilaginibacter sp.]|nr:hypothetical protein [Mucilaginibacter sp.]